jgi:cytochrome c-type biogenesis protein CcsB
MINWLNFQSSLELVAFVSLFVALVINWKNIIFYDTFPFSNLGKWSVYISNLSLFTLLFTRWLHYKYFPISNLYESLLFLTWCLTTVSIFIEAKTRFQLLSAVTLPISLFILAFASLSLPEELQQASSLVPALQSNWLMLHVSVMMISYATLILGSLLSILFLFVSKGEDISPSTSLAFDSFLEDGRLEKAVINYQSSISNRLPINSDNRGIPLQNEYCSTPINKEFFVDFPSRTSFLESLDNLSYRTIGFGFPLLTIGIISGAVWANEAWGTYWSWDPKETWALITWLIFAAYLHTRITKSWSGKKPAVLASIGFFVVWICYLGVNFLGQGLHSYGWVF